jgi:hypothetical protein
MIHKLKALGLALVAAFAIGAVMASGASAQFGTSDGPVTLVGTMTGEANANSVTGFGFVVRCPNAVGTGHKSNTTPHELIPVGATSLTITIHYGVCTVGNFPMTIDMNGCDYGVDAGETVGVDEYSGKYTITCPEGKHIVWTLFTNAAGHTENKPFCTITTTENAAGYPGIRAKDTTNGTIDLVGTVEGITAHKKSAGTDPGILCPEATTNTAVGHMDVTLTGKNSGGAPTAISISD